VRLPAVDDAITAVGPWDGSKTQSEKKRWSEILSQKLAGSLAENLRRVGFKDTRPLAGGASEKAFQGGLGPKRVDVSYADERHGLLLAVSVKTIGYPPFGKNLKNRLSDLLTEAITLHMRFPYSVISALFAFPTIADQDVGPLRKTSTFARAVRLFSLASGRREYTDPGEKFENITALLYDPVSAISPKARVVKLVDCTTGQVITETQYFDLLRQIYNERNPHAPIGSEFELDENEE
jgi:hypothetical protein